VTLTGAALGGAAAGNYTLAPARDHDDGHITPSRSRQLTAANKVYDRTTAATVTGRSLAGRGPDRRGHPHGRHGDVRRQDVGPGKTVTLATATLSGADAGNYSLTSVGTTTATIIAARDHRQLHGREQGLRRQRDGDGSADVRLSAPSTATPCSMVNGAAATFADKNVGESKVATRANAMLSGGDAANYTLGSVATTTADITARTLSVTAAGVNSVSDGTDRGDGHTRRRSRDERCPDDRLRERYVRRRERRATNKPVSVSGISIATGADAANYTLGNTTAQTTANITAAGTTTVVSLSPASQQYSDLVTFTADVTSPGGTPNGTVQFSVAGRTLAPAAGGERQRHAAGLQGHQRSGVLRRDCHLQRRHAGELPRVGRGGEAARRHGRGCRRGADEPGVRRDLQRVGDDGERPAQRDDP
jgi:hypothetical protein